MRVSSDLVVPNLTLLSTLSRSVLLSPIILVATLAGFVQSGSARPGVAPAYAFQCLAQSSYARIRPFGLDMT